MVKSGRIKARFFRLKAPSWELPEYVAARNREAAGRFLSDAHAAPAKSEITPMEKEEVEELSLGLIQEAIDSVEGGQANFMLTRPGTNFYHSLMCSSSTR